MYTISFIHVLNSPAPIKKVNHTSKKEASLGYAVQPGCIIILHIRHYALSSIWRLTNTNRAIAYIMLPASAATCNLVNTGGENTDKVNSPQKIEQVPTSDSSMSGEHRISGVLDKVLKSGPRNDTEALYQSKVQTLQPRMSP
jgi:hypothetical protein